MEQKQVTRDMQRLLYVIAQYIGVNGVFGKKVIKDLPLRGLIFKGIIDKVFDYDYAPTSVFYIDNRRYINVSQEGEDDLNDLREVGLLRKIRLATRRHSYIYCYGLTKKGIEFLNNISIEDKNAVEKLIKCECGEIFNVLVRDSGIFLKCTNCGNMLNTGITSIEDVSYVCEPIRIVTTLTKRAKLGVCLMPDEDLEINKTEIPEITRIQKESKLPKIIEPPKSQKEEPIQPIEPKTEEEWWKKQKYIDSSKLKKRDDNE